MIILNLVTRPSLFIRSIFSESCRSFCFFLYLYGSSLGVTPIIMSTTSLDIKALMGKNPIPRRVGSIKAQFQSSHEAPRSSLRVLASN